jgi:hypothetical protein
MAELGLMEMQSGRDAEALAALRKAVELDAFDQRARLLGGLDHRHQQRGRADLEHLFDQRGVTGGDTHDRVRRIGRDGLQHREHRPQVIGAVFTVDEEPVETGGRSVRRVNGVTIGTVFRGTRSIGTRPRPDNQRIGAHSKVRVANPTDPP